MKERPILFSAPMIRAILEGRKTQTRRILKCDSHIDRIGTPHEWNRGRADDRMKRWEDWGPRTGHVLLHSGTSVFALRCPYGQPGDKLWVRETWGCKDADRPGVPGGRKPQPGDSIQYAENGADAWQWRVPGSLQWRPSVHMPRWASRILLEITDVRVQRVQDISEADAIAEGAPDFEESRDAPPIDPSYEWSYRASFQRLWDSINERRGFGWDVNPWVWALTFNRVEGGERE